MDWKPQSTLIVILSPRICELSGLEGWKRGKRGFWNWAGGSWRRISRVEGEENVLE